MEEDLLRRAARLAGPRRAVIDEGAGFWVNYQQLDQLADDWAKRLVRLGVAPGQRVALQEPAGVRFAALLFAARRHRVALVPLSLSAPAAAVGKILADCRPAVIISAGAPERLGEPATGSTDDWVVAYTSGTTGPAKGVRLSERALVASAAGCAEVLKVSARDRWLLILSPHHVGGLSIFVRTVLTQGSAVAVPAFEAGAVLQAVERHSPTMASVVPTMLDQLIGAGGAEALSRLRVILVGGAAASASKLRRWQELGLQVAPSYGLTETASQIAISPPEDARAHPGPAGRVGPQARVRIERGEITVSGPCLFSGYVNPALGGPDDGGEYATGDLGELKDGVLSVAGRADDSIVTGGENVRPEEVEAVLEAHPGVQEAAVAGIADELWGQVVGAWIVGGAGPDELREWCLDRLPGFKIPRIWNRIDRLPRTEGGKLDRKALEKERP